MAVEDVDIIASPRLLYKRKSTLGREGFGMELLKVTEAAKLLKLGRTTVYLLCQRGEIPTVKIGTAVRIPSEALDAWLKQHTRDGRSD